MAAIPQAVASPTVSAIYAAYEAAAEDGRRAHLGASLIGTECERALWLGFRWATSKRHDGRLLRLFETGHMAEARFVANLRAIGMQVHEVGEDGLQFSFADESGHFGGSMDGAGLGVPEAPQTWHVLEFKTHGEKSFNKLRADGVQKSKPLHYAQMQVYMHMSGMTRALYVAVNKNTDELYAERLRYDKDFALRMMAKAERIIAARRAPSRIAVKPDFFGCKFCDHKATCWHEAPPESNCRTCIRSIAIDGGQWYCERHDKTLSIDEQKVGCLDHLYIPDFVNGEVIAAGDDSITYRLPSGEEWVNAEIPF